MPRSRVQQSSAAFGAYPDVDLSEVTLSHVHGTRYYLNSEGFKTVAPIQIAALTMYAEAQASDGMPVRQTYTAVERLLGDLPTAADLSARARELAEGVVAARAAPIGEEFAGPVLLDGTGGPQFIAETLVQLMQARRPPDAENPRMAQMQSSPFLNRTGLRVMADAFSASDTPSLTRFEGKPLAGSYEVDDEGVRAKDVTLVEKGRLATLLTSRVPQKNFPRSNGHGRSGTVLAGVFLLESAQAIPSSSLKEKYIALLKAQDKTFGYIVRGVRSDGQPGATGPAIDNIVKVTLDGHGDTGARDALRQRAADGVSRLVGSLKRAQRVFVPRRHDIDGVGGRAQPHFRGARDSPRARHSAEASGGAIAAEAAVAAGEMKMR